MTLTNEHRHVLTLIAVLLAGALGGIPIGILIAKDWKGKS